MLTKQEIYTKARKHLLAQGRRCMAVCADDNEGTYCAYRNPEGLSCAIGCLIPDNLYSDVIEGCGVGSHAREKKTAILVIFNQSGLTMGSPSIVGFLECLQAIHDEVPPDGWERRLDMLAQEHGLTVEE